MLQMIHYPVELWLLTLHLIGDFPLQPQWMVQNKTDRFDILIAHSGIHAALFAPLGFFIYPTHVGAYLFTSWIFFSHVVIDSRRWVEPKEEWRSPEVWVWLNDQILHLIALGASFWVVGLFRPGPI